MTKKQAILTAGTFGTHILKNPAGTFSFFGNVPERFRGETFATYEEAEGVFVNWFARWPEKEQRKHIGNLRNDIFEKVVAEIEVVKQKRIIQPNELKQLN